MSTRNEEHDVTCPGPIDVAVLADYWMGMLTEAEEAAVDEHLLGCDRCGARLRETIAIAEGVRTLAREQRMVVSDAYLQRAEALGLRVRRYAVHAGGSVQCTVTAKDDLLVATLAADLSEVSRADLALCDERGVERLRLRDIPIRADADHVIYQESITAMKAAPSMTMIARLVTFDEGSRERLLGEYTFHHTRSIPGPGA